MGIEIVYCRMTNAEWHRLRRNPEKAASFLFDFLPGFDRASLFDRYFGVCGPASDTYLVPQKIDEWFRVGVFAAPRSQQSASGLFGYVADLSTIIHRVESEGTEQKDRSGLAYWQIDYSQKK
jgi:hypothetical protein